MSGARPRSPRGLWATARNVVWRRIEPHRDCDRSPVARRGRAQAPRTQGPRRGTALRGGAGTRPGH
eukprot:8589579-Alexandrium_andersonii.AAC.1